LSIRTRENTNGRVPSDNQPNPLKLHACYGYYTRRKAVDKQLTRRICVVQVVTLVSRGIKLGKEGVLICMYTS